MKTRYLIQCLESNFIYFTRKETPKIALQFGKICDMSSGNKFALEITVHYFKTMF